LTLHEFLPTERLERASLPMAALSLDGELLLANDALCRLVGVPSDKLVGRAAAALCGQVAGTDVTKHWVAAIEAGEDGGELDLGLQVADGSTHDVRVAWSLVRDAHGGASYVTAVWFDDPDRLKDGRPRGHSEPARYEQPRVPQGSVNPGDAECHQQQEQLFIALSQRASDLALVTDAGGRILYVSPAVRHMLGYEAEDLIASDGWEFVHRQDVDQARAAFMIAVEQGGTQTFQARVRDIHGAWRWIEETVTNLLDTAVAGMVCNVRDVTDRIEAEQALRASEARYRAIVDTCAEGIWAAAPDGRTLYANARMATILGLPLEDVYESDVTAILDDARALEMRQRLAGQAQRDMERYEIRYRHPDGGERMLSVAATPLAGADGGIEGSIAMVSDVTDARRTEQELRHAALHDALTGLPNRALLLDRLEHALARETSSTAVVFIDLDQFKLVNDSRGHGVGDDLLVVVAERLRGAARPSDTVARFGGDEFVVICEDVHEQQAQVVAQELLASLSEPVELDVGAVHVGASVGVAVSPPQSASDLLRYADTAMYSAKSAGRGRVRRFDRSLAEEAEQRYVLAADLRVALAQETLTVHYQPVVELSSGRVLGLEALVRWDHPVHGAVPPSRFVPVAELAGLAPELDSWVLRRALHEAAAMRASGAVPPDTYIAVNVSARNLSDMNLEQLVVSTAAAADVPPRSVVLEITEGAIMDDAQVAVQLLRRLRARGFEVALDDFGTGYSSLAYLRELPITILKIDRSFVAHITDDGDALAIVASIVDLARAVGVTVVAEGVETAPQAALLRRLGCQAGQGWLWSPAVPAEAVPAACAWTRPYDPLEDHHSRPPRARREQPRVGPEHGLARLLALHHEGASLETVSAALNREGFRTPTGLRWHRTSVARAIAAAAYPSLDEG
jgi:diguanylate cyclase (GGDEF)-like protein/PAS domain S-box-containing protein